MTAVALLHLLGYEVHLFERSGALLARQSMTTHRLVHPTVNAWPFERELDPTTELPFFDWCADVCDEVLGRILNEWEAIAGADLKAMGRLHTHVAISDFDVGEDDVALITDSTGVPNTFANVIFAIGFEDESLPDHAPPQSYWENEGAEAVRNADPKARFVVSGTGDGGLIDALRLSYLKFDKGKLPLQIVTDLAGSDSEMLIEEAERAYAEGIATEEALWNAYREAARRLPPAALANIEASRVKTPHLVLLVGQEPTATARDAAPIHKLLLAHTIGKRTIKYHHGELEIDPCGSARIQVEKGPTIELGSEFRPPIVRHGARKALEWLLRHRSKVLKDLQDRQQVLADDYIRPIDPGWLAGKVPLPACLQPQDFGDREFWLDRHPRLQALSRIWPHVVAVAVTADGYEVRTRGDGWSPKKLFGVHTCSSTLPIGRPHGC
jgi:hypothetical protein